MKLPPRLTIFFDYKFAGRIQHVIRGIDNGFDPTSFLTDEKEGVPQDHPRIDSVKNRVLEHLRRSTYG